MREQEIEELVSISETALQRLAQEVDRMSFLQLQRMAEVGLAYATAVKQRGERMRTELSELKRRQSKLCAICDQTKELHQFPGVSSSHEFTPRGAQSNIKSIRDPRRGPGLPGGGE